MRNDVPIFFVERENNQPRDTYQLIMKHTSRWIWGAWGAFLVVACGTATAKNEQIAATGHSGGHHQPPHLAYSNRGSTIGSTVASRPETGSNRTAGGTSHHFEPRAIPDHGSPVYRATRAAWQLPAFVDGGAQCFRTYPEAGYYSYQGAGRSFGLGSGSGGGALSPSAVGRGRSLSAAGSKGAAAVAEAKPRPAPQAAAPLRREARSADAAAKKSESEGAVGDVAPREVTSSATVPGESGFGDEFRAPHAPQVDGFGAAIYLSNDDTMSLSSAQRLIYAIERFAPLPPEQIRPHELLNYFSFQTAPVPSNRDFSVAPSIAPHPEKSGNYTLALAVQGRQLTTATRRNANLSFVIDRSGSMAAEGRMEYVKRGMLRALRELKSGDVVGITLFDSSVCQLAQNFVVGRDSEARLRSLIERIQPTGSTDLQAGLVQGYQVADASYQSDYTNRVLMITDALTNTGITDASLISLVGKHYDERRIRLSGVGVGREFNDDLLDQLTERGKGAYVFLGSEAEVDAVFGSRFVSLVETVADDVHFRLHLPPSLAMDTFYGEEASVEKERVQSIHYFANTSQMFLSDLRTRAPGFPASDDIMLTIEYEDPETGMDRVEEYAFNLGQIYASSENIQKARLMDHFARSLGALASRGLPAQYGYQAHSWRDPAGYHECRTRGEALAALAKGVAHDPEVTKVLRLWSTVCDRYAVVEAPRPVPRPIPRPVLPIPAPTPEFNPGPPARNNDFAPPDQWPSAQR